MPEPTTVLITGTSSGIGLSTAQLLARQGFTVFGTARDLARAVPIPGVHLLPLDVRSDESVRACVEAVLARVPRLDVLVNNAGYVLVGAIEDASIEEARAQFETNFFGAARLIKAVLPQMRQARRGHIINVSSLAGLVPGPVFCGFYSASKFALESYTEHLWREVRPLGVRVSLLEPGSIRTSLSSNRHQSQEAIGDYDPWRRRGLETLRRLEENGLPPTLVADRVLEIVRSPAPKLRYRVGSDAVLVSRLRRLLPAALFEKVIRRTFRLDVEP